MFKQKDTTMAKVTKYLEKYQLAIKKIFEEDYHLIVDDDDLLHRLIRKAEEALEENEELKDEINVLNNEIDYLKEIYER